MSIHKYRRLTGLLFGAALGLMFGLTSQLTNRILLPGIPLYQPPLGPLGNILAMLLAGALLGAICAWPESSINGTFIASAVSAAIILLGNFALASDEPQPARDEADRLDRAAPAVLGAAGASSSPRCAGP